MITKNWSSLDYTVSIIPSMQKKKEIDIFMCFSSDLFHLQCNQPNDTFPSSCFAYYNTDNLLYSRARLLRANLLQPLKDIETINARLDCLVSIFSFIHIVLYYFPEANMKSLNFVFITKNFIFCGYIYFSLFFILY